MANVLHPSYAAANTSVDHMLLHASLGGVSGAVGVGGKTGGGARYLGICPQHKVGLVGGFASLLTGHLPAPLQRQAAQHARFAAANGAGS